MLELLIYSIITGVLLATILMSEPYQYILHLLRVNVKPFNCATCLSFWTFCVYGIATDPVNILFAGVAALCANISTKIYYQI